MLFAESTTQVSLGMAVFVSMVTLAGGILIGLVGGAGAVAGSIRNRERQIDLLNAKHASEIRVLEKVCENAHAGTIEVETRLAELLTAREEMAKAVAAAVNDYLMRSDCVKVPGETGRDSEGDAE